MQAIDMTVTFHALADPIRQSLVRTLADGEKRSATQLAKAFPITRQGVIKHLRVLTDAGLLHSTRDGRDVQFILTPAPLKEVTNFVRDIETLWDARLSRLKMLVESDGGAPDGMQGGTHVE